VELGSEVGSRPDLADAGEDQRRQHLLARRAAPDPVHRGRQGRRRLRLFEDARQRLDRILVRRPPARAEAPEARRAERQRAPGRRQGLAGAREKCRRGFTAEARVSAVYNSPELE